MTIFKLNYTEVELLRKLGFPHLDPPKKSLVGYPGHLGNYGGQNPHPSAENALAWGTRVGWAPQYMSEFDRAVVFAGFGGGFSGVRVHGGLESTDAFPESLAELGELLRTENPGRFRR
jgi:hypothetical protein